MLSTKEGEKCNVFCEVNIKFMFYQCNCCMQYCGMHFNHLTIPTDKFSHVSPSQMIINTTGDIYIYILKDSCVIEGMWDLK